MDVDKNREEYLKVRENYDKEKSHQSEEEIQLSTDCRQLKI